MSSPFLGQLMLAAFGFAPKGWALCNGQTMPINQNQALFSLLGTTYGGNGVQTFALPNLQGLTPVGFGTGSDATFQIGQTGGEQSHTLNANEVPNHTHAAFATAIAGNSETPGGALLAGGGPAIFGTMTSLAAMTGTMLTPFGGSQPHENRQPFLVMNWVMALSGIFPSRN
jgi:microcystin-dependent protein